MIYKFNTKSTLKVVTLLCLAIGLFGCSTYTSIQANITKNAPVHIGDAVKSVAILSRASNRSFKNYNSDSIQNKFYKERYNHSLDLYDSIAVAAAIQTASDKLFSSKRFDVVIPRNWELYSVNSASDAVPAPLIQEYINSLCEIYDTDAILILEKFDANVETKYKKIKYSNSNTQYREATIDLTYGSKWRLYVSEELKDPNAALHYVNMKADDIINWHSVEATQKEAISRLPLIAEASVESGIAAGRQLGKMLSPTTTTQVKGVFSNSNALTQEALQLASSGKWREATEKWIEAYPNCKKSTQWSVAYNIGVGFDVLGDKQSAIQWMSNSLSKKFTTNAQNYREALMRRK